MTTMQRVIATHPLASYFALTFAISWGGAILVMGASGAMSAALMNEPRFIYALMAMLAGPTVSTLVLTSVTEGRRGLRELRRRLFAWHVAARWYGVALLTAPLLWVATLFVLRQISPVFTPGVAVSPDQLALILFGLPVGIAAGAFEEIGWTGFAIPQLRQRHSPLATGLLMGVMWGAWHLLTNVFWAARVSAGDLPLSLYIPVSAIGVLAGYLVAFRVLMVWVYERTRSVLIAILMHTSLTASVLILDPAGISGSALLTYSFALAIAVWLAAAVVMVKNRWHVRRHRVQAIPASAA